MLAAGFSRRLFLLGKAHGKQDAKARAGPGCTVDIGKHGSIALIERFIRSLKDEGLRRVLVPLSLPAMRTTVSRYLEWYYTQRPHQALGGATPAEVYDGRVPANQLPRIEPRARYPDSGPCARPRASVGRRCESVTLDVRFIDAERNLPVVSLREAA